MSTLIMPIEHRTGGSNYYNYPYERGIRVIKK